MSQAPVTFIADGALLSRIERLRIMMGGPDEHAPLEVVMMTALHTLDLMLYHRSSTATHKVYIRLGGYTPETGHPWFMGLTSVDAPTPIDVKSHEEQLSGPFRAINVDATE